ncbi:Calcium/calmodulin-dependent protein kinase type II [Porphyridium purpureum]|uniref:Calcium/calmodulin-dependent protein kinase type II n=1 Tax=Porphyridium purpureum TaxID=35688 RepID=A0A5J4YYM2_PORPP|nr:Calcium/calmodulin-dependent protein kinase type II [Porphyridium purpureum]|eukprot:POR4315..scf209_3
MMRKQGPAMAHAFSHQFDRTGDSCEISEGPHTETRVLSQATELLTRGIVLCSEIAKGGQGSVWRAVQSDQTQVAVKIISKRFLGNGVVCSRQEKHVLREAMILRSTQHPGVVKFVDFCESETQWFLVTELVDGDDLFELLNKGSLSESQLLFLTAQVLHTLAYLHSCGIAHRDIKLENVMVTRNPKMCIKLIDFGLSHWIEMDGSNVVNEFPGTKQYKAPELLLRVPNTDPRRADLFALGVILFVIITGSFPMSDKDLDARRIRKGSISFKSSAWKRVSEKTQNLTAALLDVDPSTRVSAVEAYGIVKAQLVAAAAHARAGTQEDHQEQTSPAGITAVSASGAGSKSAGRTKNMISQMMVPMMNKFAASTAV